LQQRSGTQTLAILISSKSLAHQIITRNLNPVEGCEFAWQYCYHRKNYLKRKKKWNLMGHY